MEKCILRYANEFEFDDLKTNAVMNTKMLE